MLASLLFFATLSHFWVEGLGVTSMLASLLFFARLTHWRKFSKVRALVYSLYRGFFFFKNLCLSYCGALVYSLSLARRGYFFLFWELVPALLRCPSVLTISRQRRGYCFPRICACPTAMPGALAACCIIGNSAPLGPWSVVCLLLSLSIL